MPSSRVPTQSQLDKYSLTLGDAARARDTECNICQETTTNAVITACLHIFCFECLRTWANRSATCPACREALAPRLQTPPFQAPTGTISATSPDPTYPPSEHGNPRTIMHPATRMINRYRNRASNHLLRNHLPADASPDQARTCGAVVVDAAAMTAKLHAVTDESLARVISRWPLGSRGQDAQDFFAVNVADWMQLLSALDRYVFVERDLVALLMTGVNGYAAMREPMPYASGARRAFTTSLVDLFGVLADKIVKT